MWLGLLILHQYTQYVFTVFLCAVFGCSGAGLIALLWGIALPVCRCPLILPLRRAVEINLMPFYPSFCHHGDYCVLGAVCLAWWLPLLSPMHTHTRTRTHTHTRACAWASAFLSSGPLCLNTGLLLTPYMGFSLGCDVLEKSGCQRTFSCVSLFD